MSIFRGTAESEWVYEKHDNTYNNKIFMENVLVTKRPDKGPEGFRRFLEYLNKTLDTSTNSVYAFRFTLREFIDLFLVFHHAGDLDNNVMHGLLNQIEEFHAIACSLNLYMRYCGKHMAFEFMYLGDTSKQDHNTPDFPQRSRFELFERGKRYNN